uniref:Deoxynucleoside triphosphate triphosphohydrolase SAMHD1 n=2 Tax=Schistocephalus solidus TaxID=70667 RepID=A0A0V0J3H5_SCHSO
MVSTKPAKVFQDAIHGLIEVEPLMLQVIDTPEFQRLRNIKQLGPVYFVFPTCSHTRFEHSLGTYHLVSRLLRALQADVPCEAVRLNEAECSALKLAALCHDLGHGPFSHLWEYFMRSGGPKYEVVTHEKMSGRILRWIIQQNPDLAASISEAAIDLDLVCALIEANPSREQLKSLKEKSFIFELLSNSTNGMDADKWEYILRDSFYLGWGQGCSTLELERFLWFYRLVFHPPEASSDCGGEESCGSWHMSFRDSEIENVMRTFSQRLHLHRQVYSHKTSKAIAAMFLDILKELDSVMQLRELTLLAATSDDLAHLSAYLRLDDYAIWAMASNYMSLPPALAYKDDHKAVFARTANLCRRIQTRHLYTFIGCIYCVSSNAEPQQQQQQPQREPFPGEVKHICLGDASRSERPNSCESIAAKYAFNTMAFAMDSNQTIPIPRDDLGSREKILEEIYAELPEDSVVKRQQELRLIECQFRSNSTSSTPVFFFYKASGETFTFKQPLTSVISFKLYWNGGEGSNVKKVGEPPCLLEAFQRWRDAKLAAYTKMLHST